MVSFPTPGSGRWTAWWKHRKQIQRQAAIVFAGLLGLWAMSWRPATLYANPGPPTLDDFWSGGRG